MTDVVVVGASVAGLSAARSAAEAGADVLLVDRRAGPREQVPPAAIAFDALWPPTRELAAAQVSRYEHIRVRAGATSALVRAGARLYDRGRLDELLAAAASRAGATLQWGTRDVIVRPDRTVRWRGGTTHPKILILADGPDGWARKFVDNLDDPEEMRFGQAWRIDDVIGPTDVLEIAFTPNLAGGRLQLNPTREHTIVWALQYDGAASRKSVLASHPALEGYSKDDLVPLGSPRPDPVFALPGKITADSMMVVGGAAGQGGLELGFLSGTDVGRVAAQALEAGRTSAGYLYEQYEEPWKKRWMGGLERFRSSYNRFAAMDVAEQEKILEPWTHQGLDLHDVSIPILEPGVRRSWAALKTSLRNARRMRALLHTYRQLKG